jgi:hypothetical protein
MFTITVRYESGSEGTFGPVADRNVATQLLALIAGKPNVISAYIAENRVIG